MKILSETYKSTQLGNCYYHDEYTVVVEGHHADDVSNDFGNAYINKNRRGQGNSFNGFERCEDGNMKFFFSHSIDSGD